jgi:hypothetical protein
MPSKRHRSCQNSLVPQKIGSLNWKLRTSFIAKGRSVPKNGFAEFTRKSKVGLSESHEATGRCPVGNVRLVILMMRDDEKIHVDATRPATLHNGTAWAGGQEQAPPGYPGSITQ